MVEAVKTVSGVCSPDSPRPRSRPYLETEGEGLEPPSACARRFSRPLPYQLGLSLQQSKNNRLALNPDDHREANSSPIPVACAIRFVWSRILAASAVAPRSANA